MKAVFLTILGILISFASLSQTKDADQIRLRYILSPIQLVHPGTPTIKSGIEVGMGKIGLWYEHGFQIPILHSLWGDIGRLNVSDKSYWKAQGGIRWYVTEFSSLQIFTGLHVSHFPQRYLSEKDWYLSSSLDPYYYDKANISIKRTAYRAEIGFRYQRNRWGLDISCAVGTMQREVQYSDLINETLAVEYLNDFLILRPDRRAGRTVIPTAIANIRLHYLLF